MDDLVAGSPYAADAEIDTKDGEERMRRLNDMLDGFDGRHVRATATVDASGGLPDPGKGDVNKPDGSTPPPSSGPTPPQGPALASGTGGWVTVPPGYPNDTYNARLTSGEQFAVIPAGGGKAGMGAITNNFYIHGNDPQQIAQEVGVILARQARLNKAARI